MLRLDHITVAANDLAEGVAYVEKALGILVEFEIRHPEADTILSSLAGFLDDPRIRFSRASEPSFRAVIRTPRGDRQLV